MAASIPAPPTFLPQGSTPSEACRPQLPPWPSNPLPPTMKTPVSELMELTMRMGLAVRFEITAETGASHTKLFTMCCTVADVAAEGSASNKKKAKQEAATLVLSKLKESQIYIDYVNQWTTQAALAPHNNPIGRLQEVAAKKGLQNPAFEVSNSEGPPHQRIFETRVTVGDVLCSGKGRSKKESKRKAAAAMLDTLNNSNLALEPPTKKVTFVSAGSPTPAPVSFVPAGAL